MSGPLDVTLVEPGVMRVVLTVRPSGVVGETAITVTPEQVAGGWPVVLKILLASLEITAHEMVRTAPAPAPVGVQVVPGGVH